MKKQLLIDTVDYSVGGGLEIWGVLPLKYGDKITVKTESNMTGMVTGRVECWTIDCDINDIADDYNQIYTYEDMLSGDGIAYIATLDKTLKRGYIVE